MVSRTKAKQFFFKIYAGPANQKPNAKKCQKNLGTDGSNGVAYDAIRAASNGHHFLSVTKQGLSAIVQTEGNDACHVILRGGKSGTNFDAEAIKKTSEELAKVKLAPVVMVDCSHGNSSKDHKRQPIVAQSIVSTLEVLLVIERETWIEKSNKTMYT